MRPFALSALLLVATFVFAATAFAQGTKADYRRSAELSNMIRGKVDREHVEPRWFDDNRQFWYRIRPGVNRFEFNVVDAEKGARRPAFDQQRMAEVLRKAGVANVNLTPVCPTAYCGLKLLRRNISIWTFRVWAFMAVRRAARARLLRP